MGRFSFIRIGIAVLLAGSMGCDPSPAPQTLPSPTYAVPRLALSTIKTNGIPVSVTSITLPEPPPEQISGVPVQSTSSIGSYALMITLVSGHTPWTVHLLACPRGRDTWTVDRLGELEHAIRAHTISGDARLIEMEGQIAEGRFYPTSLRYDGETYFSP